MAVMDKLDFSTCFLVRTTDTETRIGMTCMDTNDRIKCSDHITADFFTHQIAVMDRLNFSVCFFVRTTDTETRIGMTCIDTNEKV
jgi:hypothetical protein